jgi:hypothetical protein
MQCVVENGHWSTDNLCEQGGAETKSQRESDQRGAARQVQKLHENHLLVQGRL